MRKVDWQLGREPLRLTYHMCGLHFDRHRSVLEGGVARAGGWFELCFFIQVVGWFFLFLTNYVLLRRRRWLSRCVFGIGDLVLCVCLWWMNVLSVVCCCCCCVFSGVATCGTTTSARSWDALTRARQDGEGGAARQGTGGGAACSGGGEEYRYVDHYR